ncbi:MAG TPA: FG-GAP-like repeat-containing protein [Saprospiraceae bacterium]|nr:FG-GAP-like repeat-containing protein [Saprospiraceae bacterium]
MKAILKGNQTIKPFIKLGVIALLVLIIGSWVLIRKTGHVKDLSYIRQTAASSAVGYLPGEFELAATGDPQYSIELEVPPGTNDVQPEISLSYSNSGSNGILGYGWQLNGLSVITRTGRNIQEDGISSGITLTYNDRFAINGQRLIAYKDKQGKVLSTRAERAAAYGREGTEYRTEIESGTKVYSIGVCGNGPCSFKAAMKDGSTIDFAQTDNSRIQPAGSPAVTMWAANQVTDANKNYVTVKYHQDFADGFFVPEEINYTGNASTNLLPQRRIHFEYETRQDTILNFLLGLKFSCGQRMKSIKTYVDLDGDAQNINAPQNLVSNYSIGYKYSISSQRSVITSIGLCDAQGTCLPATTMDLTSLDPDKPFAEMLTTLPPGFANYLVKDVEKVKADFDGNGKVDILLMRQNNPVMPFIYSNASGAFEIINAAVPSGYAGYLNNPNVTTIAADYNGDGKTDLLFFEKAKSTVAIIYATDFGKFEGTTKQLPKDFNTLFNQSDVEKISGDVNGDGLVDILGFKTGYQSVPVLMAQQGGEFTGKVVKLPSTVAPYFNPAGARHASGDFNGDGLTDVITFSQGYQSMPAIYSDGKGEFTASLERYPASVSQLVNSPNTERITGDFNGDGIVDLSLFIEGGKTIPVLYSLGNGAFQDYFVKLPLVDAEYFTSKRSEKVLGDINGDGITDIMAFQTGLKSVPSMISQSQGKYIYKQIQISPDLANAINTDGVERMVTDFNGDGLIDVAGIKEGFTKLPMLVAYKFDDKNNQPDLIRSITDGIGKVIEINYLPLTNSSIYDKGTPVSYPYYTAQFATYVVSDYRALEKKVNPTSVLAFSVKYSGAVINNFNGFLGFQSISTKDDQRDLVIKTSYAMTFPFAGTVESKIIHASGNPDKILGKEIYTYQHDSIPYSSVQMVWNSAYRMEHYTNGNFNYSLEKKFNYDDQHNNVVRIDDLGDIAVAGDEVYTNFKYRVADPNSQEWWKSYFPVAEKGLKTNLNPDWNTWTSNDLYWKRMGYDVNMNMTIDSGYMNDNGLKNSFWVAGQLTFDPYGNTIAKTYAPNQGNSPIVTRTIFDNVFHTFIVESINTPGSPDNPASPSLHARFTNDPRWGLKISDLDPNGNLIMNIPDNGIDGFGRVLIIQGTNPDDKTLINLSVSSYLEGKAGVGYYILTQSPNSWQDGNVPTANWAFTKTYYDGMDREVTTEVNGTGPANNIIETIEYNLKGQVYRQYAPRYQNAPPDSVSFTQQSYYPHGQLQKIESSAPNGSGQLLLSEEYLYDPLNSLIVYIKKPSPVSNSEVVYYKEIYDYTGNVISNSGPYTTPGQPGGEFGETSYSYDQLERLYKVIDPLGQPTYYYHNSTGQIIKQFQAETDTTYFVFDKNELQIQNITAKGTLRWEYDDLARPLYQMQRPTGGPEDTISSYIYDDLTISPNGLGQLSSNSTRDVRYTYAYANTGDPYQKSTFFKELNQTFIQGFAFDPQDRLYKSVYPDNAILTYKYDYAGNYSHVLLNQDTLTSYPSYNASGEILKIKFGNRVESNFQYDLAGRIRQTQTKKSQYYHGDISYQWNNANVINTITDNRPVKEVDQSGSYQYAQSGRLTASSSGTGNEHMNYDPAGNRTSLNTEIYHYSSQKKHQLDSITRNDTTLFRFAYSKTGNLISKFIKRDSLGKKANLTFAYDFSVDGNLNSVSLANEGLLSSYTYNGNNERVIKRDPDGVVTYYISEFYEAVRLSSGQLLYTTYCHDDQGVLYASTRDAASVKLLKKGNMEQVLRGSVDPGWFSIFIGGLLNEMKNFDRYLFILGLATIFIWQFSLIIRQRKKSRSWRTPFRPVSSIRYSLMLIACLTMVMEPLVAQSPLGMTPGPNGPGVPEKGEIRYFHQNQVGSNLMLTDPTGGLANSLLYSSFGKLAKEKSTGVNNFRGKFTGKELDEYTGLQYFGTRYYDAHIGRFISPDPGNQYFSPYLYGDNNPISGTDPDGSLFFEIALIVAAIVFAYAGAALANGTLNPAEWEWDSADTWIGIISGAITGVAVVATGGAALAAFGVVSAQSVTVAGLSAGTIAFTADIAIVGVDAGVFASDPSLSNGIMLGIDLVTFGAALIGRFGKGARAAAKGGDSGVTAGSKSSRVNSVDNLFEVCPLSLVQGTSVTSSAGEVPIENIQVGDEVLSYDLERDQYVFSPVSQIFRRVATGLIVIGIGCCDTVYATPEHPFLTSDDVFIEAQFMTVGTRLQHFDDTYYPPEEIRRDASEMVTFLIPLPDTTTTVYNFEVEGTHNYTIGKEKVVVHNPCKTPSKRLRALGKTPGKNTKTGRTVFQRMELKGIARIKGGKKQVKVRMKLGGPRVWQPLDRNIHMGHILDAVSVWNSGDSKYFGGKPLYKFGAKSKEARTFMLDPHNYELEYGPLNSSNGAKLGQTYVQPKGFTGTW